MSPGMSSPASVEKRAEARRLRAKGQLQREVADRLGVWQSTISSWENPPTYQPVDYRRAAMALGVLLDNSGPTIPKKFIWPDYKEPMAPTRPVPWAREWSLDAEFETPGHPYSRLGDQLADSSLDPAEMVERGEIS